MLSGFSEAIQIKLLEGSLDADPTVDGLAPLVKAWQTSDEAAIEKLLFSIPDNSPEYKAYMTEMFDNRNVGMANKIEKYLTGSTKGTYFVVVGAGHYFGDMSIIELLEKKGYKIQKLQ